MTKELPTTAEQPVTSIEINDPDTQISLRQLTPNDAQKLFDLIDSNREHLSQFGENTAEKYPTTESVEKSILQPINPRRLRFGIWNNGNIIGSINITPLETQYRAEIGYYVGEEFTGKGYTTRAVEMLTQFGFEELRFRTIIAEVRSDNNASARVLEKAGYVKERQHSSFVLRYTSTKPPTTIAD
ncbi:GNAT family N-acetyltransferase [Candidatus Roizmanbacteria bacterium]|nr:GNAT family N-acetyltransferase [Candidatus Roizmanbacteria bacterium]